MVSEVKLLLHWVALVPLGSVHVPNLLDLFDQLFLLTMLREHEEEVKLRAPLKLDPGHTVFVNHRLNDVVFLDLPHCGDRGLLLFLSGGSCDGAGGVGHGCSPCVVRRYSHSVNANSAVGCLSYPQLLGLTVMSDMRAESSQKEC